MLGMCDADAALYRCMMMMVVVGGCECDEMYAVSLSVRDIIARIYSIKSR